MINEFITSIAKAIFNVAGNVTIYSEDIAQNFITPSYYIHSINHNQRLMTAGRRKLTMYEVVFFPTENGENKNEEMNIAVEMLVEELCCVEHDGHKYKATEVSVENTGEELHYIASYNYNTLYEQRGESMQDMDINTKIKGENSYG